jgi:sugar/nucleoside kinase (ribokinase family)
MKFDVYSIGNPLIDIVVRVSDKDIKDLKLRKGAMRLINVRELKRINDLIKDKDKTTGPAGSCANTAMFLANLGCKAVFAGKIGNDENGLNYEREILLSGVASDLVKDKGVTGSCINFVTPDFERTMTTCLGISSKFGFKDVNEKNISKSKFLHIEGYQLDVPRQKKAILHAINIAKGNGVKVSFDLADPLAVERHKNYLPRIIGSSDIIFANDAEARALTNSKPEKAIKLIDSETVIVKLGTKGSIIKNKDKIIKIKSYKANTMDTTGAGDIYAAGFLYGLSKGHDLELCGKIGSYSAAKIVEQMGARFKYDMKPRLSWITKHL